MPIPALKWRTAPVRLDSERVRASTAEGYWPGWTYELIKLTGGHWEAWFVDGPESRYRIGRGNFMQARAAAIAHHNHPE